MKKILLFLALVTLLIGLVAPSIVSAAPDAPTSCTMRRNVNDYLGTGATCLGVDETVHYNANYGTVTGAMCCLFSTIVYIIDWLFMILMVVVVLMILLGAFTLMTSGGSEEGIKKGRNYIVFALIGVAVALLARALPYLIRSIIGA